MLFRSIFALWSAKVLVSGFVFVSLARHKIAAPQNRAAQPNTLMADKTSKQPEGVPGKWYVDTTCVPCNSCMDEAPNLLKYSEDQSHVFFAKQPATPEEEAAALRALDICPTGSIGNDGP